MNSSKTKKKKETKREEEVKEIVVDPMLKLLHNTRDYFTPPNEYKFVSVFSL